MNHRAHTTDGFTLIELSIVIVVIGLIAGGILVGQDLIEGAKLRAQISQIEEFTTAANTFRVKYNCLPGDCPKAVALGLGTNASYHNGNGDKKIDNHCVSQTVRSQNNYSKESMNFFMHLGNAGLVDGTYTGYAGQAHNTSFTNSEFAAAYPKAKYNKGYVFAQYFATSPFYCAGGDYEAYLRNGGNGFSIANLGLSEIMTKENVEMMDQKLDDGRPLTGKLGMGGQGNGMPGFIAALGAPYSTCGKVTYSTMHVGCTALKAVFLFKY